MVKSTIMLTTIWAYFMLANFHLPPVDCLSLKVGNPANPNLQTGQTVLLSTSLPLNTTTYYTITFLNPMGTNILETALGVVGSTFIIEREQGWSMYVTQANQTEMTVELWSNYDLFTPSSTLSYLKIRYLVSCHPYVEIDYVAHTFSSADNVTDPYTYDESCQFIRCRKKAITVNYAVPKATVLSIGGVAFMAGYAISDLPADGELMIPTSVNWGTTWTFTNYTQDNYYGINVQVGSHTTTNCQLTVTVYGLIKLSKIYVYFLTFESTLTNTYKTRVLTGTSTIGCYFDAGGCIYPLKIKVNSNTTISSAPTSITTFFDNMYFFGLNHFILYHQYNDLDFTNPSYADPAVKMSFDATSSFLNADIYKTDFSFTGNPNNMFTFKFGYLIDLNFDCPSSGDIYHISSTQCNSSCPSNFYPDANKYCFKCSTQCFQCTGPSNNDCTSCYTTTQHRVLNGTTCMCQPLYYYENLIADICPSCSYTCLSCFAPGVSNCLSCNATDNRYSDNASSCPCLAGFYDNGGRTCVACHFTCATCTAGAANNCLTCPSLATTFRNITSNQCNCIPGYIHTGVLICSKCQYSCKTCQASQTNCSTCEATDQRTLNNATNTCPCNNGYYDDGSSSQCQPCFITCKTCNGPSSTDCTGCRATDPRALNSPTGQCLCTAGFYDFNNSCVACHYTCLNCTSNTPTACLSCDASKFRAFNSTANTCPCNDGYFDLLSTPTPTPACQPCDSKCATCELTLTRCLSCRASDFRELVSNACPCIFGYADVAGVCTACHYSCESCSGPLATDCLTCNMTARFPSGTSCLCRPGTYDDGMQEHCPACHLHCVECTAGTNDSCTVCDASMKRLAPATTPSFCFCMGHYFNSGPAACSTCFSQCATCEYNATHCLTCNASQFRVANSLHVCQCSPHYYDTGADVCLTCASQCYECSVISTNCTSCPVLRTLVNQTCPCVANYFEDPSNGSCLQCGVLCRLCHTSATQCTQCYPSMNRYLNGSQCACSFGFYYDGANPVCLACPYYCQNCSSPSACLECAPTSHRFLAAGLCRCSPGYYDDGVSPTCLACSPLCQECTDYLVCTLCDASLHRQIVLNNCVCFGKFYDVFTLATPTTLCAPCHYSCATCSAGTGLTCITCEPNRNFTNYTCPCSDGYYESMQICNLCDPLCRTCYGIPTNCTSCFSGLPLVGGTCLCYSHQYMSGTTCYPCDPKCKECFGVATFCTECYAAHLTNLTSNDCTCQSGMFKDPSLVCTPCHFDCLECTGPTSNECTACDGSLNRILSGTQCLCNTNFYLNTANGTCVLCHSSCSVCSGPSNYNCSACQPNFTLIGSYCKPLVSCANYQYEAQCVDVCPKNSYPTALHTCEKCTNGCLYCRSDTVCLECQPGYIFNSATGACIAICQNGKYISPSGSCLPCFSNCLECQWNSPKNTVTCLKCAPSFYLKDGECSPTCATPYYHPVGSLCIKCLGNCLTCNSLSPSDCVLCKEGLSFLSGQCYSVCPMGHYRQQLGSAPSTCELCPSECSSCASGECLSCSPGFHLSNGKCTENGYFFDPKQNTTSRCHPNCVSCTNTSFSSCVACRPHRGDKSQMAVSGYCECRQDSIDMGNGVCDFEKFAELLKLTQTLVSFSSSAFYLTALTSIVSTNYVGLLAMLGYLQSYSNFYYLNASYVMSLDYVLREYRKTNLNSFFHSQAEDPTRRLLLELQSDKSLFLRDQPYMYLIEWALVPSILIGIAWSLSLILFCCQRRLTEVKYNKNVEKILKKSTNETDETFRQKYKQFEPDKNELVPVSTGTQKSIKKEEVEVESGKCQIDIMKYIHLFYKQYHESVMIVLHFVFSTELTLYAVASFKILATTNQNLQLGKLILSVLLVGYISSYTMRLLVGSYRFANKRNVLPHESVLKNPLRILFHLHLQQKSSPFNAIYAPALLLRNQLMSIVLVLFSSNPSVQILTSGVVLVVFALYSLLCCPYTPMIRLSLHFVELVFIIQLVIMFLVTSIEYGTVYNLDISSGDGSLYRFAWALLSINYLQILIFAILAFLILFDLSRAKICRRNQVKNEGTLKDCLPSSGHPHRKQKQMLQQSNEALASNITKQDMEEEMNGDEKQIESFERGPYPLLKRQRQNERKERPFEHSDDPIVEKVITKKYRVVGRQHNKNLGSGGKDEEIIQENKHFSISLTRTKDQQRDGQKQEYVFFPHSTPLKNIEY